ncbi:MAG: radical SAM protein [Chloroflexi bacterium]|nr:radical SAM protein [Chloroflexota bacterium]
MRGKLQIPSWLKALAGKAVNLSHPMALTPVSELNGPGVRLVFWTQGCSLRCTRKCLNPQSLPIRPANVVNIPDMVEFIGRKLSGEPATKGLTFLGGEPFDQSLSLASVARSAREMGLSVVTYTGYLHEDLVKNGDAGDLALLSRTDILIDGPYMPEHAVPGLLWRGSSNQRILLLNPEYGKLITEEDLIPRQGLDVQWTGEDTLMVSGFQQAGLAEAFLDALARRGVVTRAKTRVPARSTSS